MLIHLLRARSLKKFEVLGGLVSGTEESRGKISLDRPNRQWDYPYVIIKPEEFLGGADSVTCIRYAWSVAFIQNTMPWSQTLFYLRPPHQIMTWVGLERYGYLDEAQRLAYRFLYMFVFFALFILD